MSDANEPTKMRGWMIQWKSRLGGKFEKKIYLSREDAKKHLSFMGIVSGCHDLYIKQLRIREVVILLKGRKP